MPNARKAAARSPGAHDLSRSNSLADLAARIRTEHEATAIAMRRGVEHAMVAGDLLLEAKAQIRHGQWLPWLAEHCRIPERTARLYMRLAKNRATIETEIGNVADLTIRSAVALITLPRASDKMALGLLDSIAELAEEESVFAALFAADEQRAVRRAALEDAARAIDRIIEISSAQPEIAATAVSVWDEDQLGERLESAIADCTRWLTASFEVEHLIDPAPQATAAAITAKDVATEMLRRVARGAP